MSSTLSSNVLETAAQQRENGENQSSKVAIDETAPGDNEKEDVGGGGDEEEMGGCKENAPVEKEDGTSSDNDKEMIHFKLAYGREMHDICAPANQTVTAFMDTVHSLTDVPPEMQKLVCKGSKLLSTQTLSEAKVNSGAKILLIGSTAAQVEGAKAKPSASTAVEPVAASTSKEPLSKQKMHAKLIDQGPPDDVMEALPQAPLRGMRNKHGRSVRLTFKLELDQLWIGTPERTDKIPMGHINDVISEPIVDREEYSIIGIGVGATEQSRIWIYWVPSQYVAAIRRAVLE